MAKSTMHVVPPWAAASVPVSKSSLDEVPPKGMSRWVCASMPPGRMYFPLASMVLSHVPVGAAWGAKRAAILPSMMATSAAYVSTAVTTVPPWMSVLAMVGASLRRGGVTGNGLDRGSVRQEESAHGARVVSPSGSSGRVRTAVRSHTTVRLAAYESPLSAHEPPCVPVGASSCQRTSSVVSAHDPRWLTREGPYA